MIHSKTKYILLSGFLAISIFTSAMQNDTVISKAEFKSEILKLTGKIQTLEKEFRNILKKDTDQKKTIDSISTSLSLVNSSLKDSLHLSVQHNNSITQQTQNQILAINQTISTRTLYWIIGILTFVLLGFIAFILLQRKMRASTQDIYTKISNTKQALETEAIKLDTKLIEILQTQLTIKQEEKSSGKAVIMELDHKLPLKVGEEIHRMRKRIENMPQDVKGLSALRNSLQRLEEQFNESGYTIDDLLGKKYIDGMKLEARFVDNPNVPKGEEIITDVIRPQIMYKGIVVQVAKVEVGKS